MYVGSSWHGPDAGGGGGGGGDTTTGGGCGVCGGIPVGDAVGGGSGVQSGVTSMHETGHEYMRRAICSGNWPLTMKWRSIPMR